MNYSCFRNLLRKAVGNDNKDAFAERAGISSKYLTLLMGYGDIPCPGRDVIKSIVIASCGRVSLWELECALGYRIRSRGIPYERRPDFEQAKVNRDDISKGLNEIFMRSVLWDRPDDIINTAIALYCPNCIDCYVTGTVSFGTPHNITRCVLCTVVYPCSGDMSRVMQQYVMLYISRAGTEKYVLSGWAFDCASIEASGWTFDVPDPRGRKPNYVTKEVCYIIERKSPIAHKISKC